MKARIPIGFFLLCLIGLIAAMVFPQGARAEDPVTLKVYDPTGAIKVSQLFAPRLSDLHGKTICELSNASWEAQRTFPAIRDLLRRQYPTAKVIPYTEFPEGTAKIDSPGIGKIVKDKGCDAVIVGNAG